MAEVGALTSSTIVDQIQEDHLTCRICYNQYVRPKALPCLHSFCLTCLQSYLDSKRYDKTFPCPLCRKNVKLPKAKAKGFPDNHLLVSLLDTLENPPPVPPAPPPPPDAPPSESTSTDEGISSPSATPVVITIALPARPVEPSAPEAPLSPPPSPPPPYQFEDPAVSYPAYGSIAEITANLDITRGSPEPGSQSVSMTELDYPPEVREDAENSHQMELDYDFCSDVLPEEYFFLSCFGQYGPGLYDFSRPTGIGILHDGKIVVSDQRDNRILIFNTDGTPYTMFKCNANIRDLVVAHDNTIIVVVNKSSANSSAMAHIYTTNGDLISTIGNVFTYFDLYGLAITETGKTSLITTDVIHGKVYVVNAKGKMTAQFGSRGKDEKHFKKPYYVCTKSGLIYVSDAEHNSIKVFGMNGEFQYQFGGELGKPGTLCNPQGICTDHQGNLIVADTGNHSIQIFSPSGKHLQTFITYNTQANNAQRLRPLNVAMTHTGNLAVLVIAAGFSQVRMYYYTPSATPTSANSAVICHIL